MLVKEFRTRMRGARAYWVLLVYVLLLTLVVGVHLSELVRQTSAGGRQPPGRLSDGTRVCSRCSSRCRRDWWR